MPDYDLTSVNVLLIEAAYPDKALDYYAIEQHLRVYRNIGRNQKRLPGELWQSIKVDRSPTGKPIGITITTAPAEIKFFDIPALKREATICQNRITARTPIKIIGVDIDQHACSITVKLVPGWKQDRLIEALLLTDLDFLGLDPDFNQAYATIDYEYFEQLKQKALIDMAPTLGGSAQALLLILEMNPYATNRS